VSAGEGVGILSGIYHAMEREKEADPSNGYFYDFAL
jgi:hypothetical protein